jgi:hypothetical protein
MVAEATINKHANLLVAQYIKRYEEIYGRPPELNRYRDKWGFRGMYEDLGSKQAERVVEYYFKTSHPGHPLAYLLYNYDKLNRILVELDNDEQNRIRLRKETEERVKKWEEMNSANK